MTPYAIALLERLSAYTGWLALAVTCHPVISLGRRTVLTRGSRWALALAVLLTTLSVAIEFGVMTPSDLTTTTSLAPPLQFATRLSPSLSLTWALMVWSGMLLLMLRPDQQAARTWARRALAFGCLCGASVCVTRFTLAAVAQPPW